MTSKTDQAGIVTQYGYDNLGRLTTVTQDVGDTGHLNLVTNYGYDQLNRLASVTVPGQAPTQYTYDEVGNLGGYTLPNGVAVAYSYNELNRLHEMASNANGNAVSRYTYTLGAAGNRTAVSELSGKTVQWSYDNLYRLTSEQITNDPAGKNGSVGYTYDPVGNRKSINSTLAAIPPAGMLYYDANDRTSTDTYDNDGNTVWQGGIQNQYDFENHLVQHGDVKLVYDGDGNRVAETIGGVTTNYLVDDVNPTGYVQTLDELQSGSVARSYTWGHWLLSETQKIASAWQTSYYGDDGHGSVRQLFDGSGAITDTYDYDAFGNLTNSTGSTPNVYLYSGEAYDSTLGLSYNRARYLDVRTGRFLTPDSYEGDSNDSRSLHRYGYAANSPVGLLDHSGMDYLSDPLIGMEVHRKLGDLYSLQFGMNACVNQQMINILASDCGASWEFGLSFPSGLRPDLANIQSGALFEIKPIRGAGSALAQVLVYGAILRLADPKNRDWHLGRASEFSYPTVIPLDDRLHVAYVAPPVLGVILYWVAGAEDAFDLTLLEAANIYSALGATATAAPAAASNVVSISTGTGIAGAAASAETGEIVDDIGVSIALPGAA